MTKLPKTSWTLLFLACISTAVQIADLSAADFRPPAVPLVTYNPFLSIWSETDRLAEANTKHWTRHDHSLISLLRIDGKTYRLMGWDPQSVPAFPQVSVQVLPTRSLYEFEGSGVHLTMTFLQPALPDDLDVYSWPLSYITWNVRSIDGAKHTLEIYDSVSSELCVNKPGELVEWSRAAGRSDAAAHGHETAADSRFLWRRSSHQLGLRLRRRAEGAGAKCDGRKWSVVEQLRRQRHAARTGRHAHAAGHDGRPARAGLRVRPG